MRIFNETDEINVSSNLLGQASKKLMSTTAITAAGLLAFSVNAQAQSVGNNDWTDHVAVGGGTISIDTSVPDTTNITQTGSYVTVSGDGDIKAGWTVNVAQPSSSAKYILFDTEGDPTKIKGNLNANGEIWIFDQNGIIFGADSSVNVGSLVATTASIGILNTGDETYQLSNLGDGEIVNKGTITVADAGLAAFVAPTIKNSGVIKAKMGKVVMAAGETVTLDMYGDGLMEVAVDGELSDGLIENTGDIIAKGGDVIVTAAVAKNAVDNVINMDGVVDVRSATVKGGKIILSGGSSGQVQVKGKLKASGKNGTDAGSIDVTGENIKISKNAILKANAGEESAAGDINVVADSDLVINGKISAQGLVGTGFVETSAPNTIFGANASILATREWLLDPTDVTIDAALATLIEGQLAVGDMTVQTPVSGSDAGNIIVRSVIDWTSDKTFSLLAANDIAVTLNGGILATGGGDFVATAGDDFRMIGGNDSIIMNGGNVTVNTGDEFTIGEGFILAGGGDITINNTESFEALANSLLTSGTGTITINQNKDANENTSTTDPSIQNAIDAILNTGTGKNTVNVGAGIWKESVEANLDNLVLNGANAGVSGASDSRVGESVIKPNSPGVHITANNVTLDGFKIKGADNGVFVEGADNVIIKNNIIKNSSNDGVKANDSNSLIIKRNKIDNTDSDGIDLNNSNDALIKNNTLINIGDGGDDNGIEVGNSNNAVIAKNILNNIVDDAIDLDGSDNAIIEENKIGLLGGIDNIGDDGVDLNDSEGAIIRDNKIQNTVETGIDVRGSDNTDIINNTIKFAGLNGVYVNPSYYVRILDNTITDVAEDGIQVNSGYDIRVRRNTVRRTGDDGIDISRNNRVRITDNTVTEIGDRGISVDRSFGDTDEFSAVVARNVVKDTYRDGININRFTTARVVDNTVRGSTTRSGVSVGVGDYARVRRNDVSDILRYGIGVAGVGEVDVSSNTIRDARRDGIYVGNFGDAWIEYNDVRNTGDDGIDVRDGEYVAIYNNVIRKSGFYGEGSYADDAGADGISVTRVGGSSMVPTIISSLSVPGDVSYFGFNVDIEGNDVRRTYDDGIEVTDGGSTWISDNILRHIGYGGEVYYGGGDYYGADAIHVRNVSGLPYGYPVPVAARSGDGGYRDGYFPSGAPWDYSTVVIFNDINKTADDGIEIVGSAIIPTAALSIGDGDGGPVASGPVLVAWNDVRNAGYGLVGDGGDGDGSPYGEYAPDGYGADAIHVRGIRRGLSIGDGDGSETLDIASIGDGDGFPEMNPMQWQADGYGYDVEILENHVWTTGDDGVEVRNSGKTIVAGNDISNTGLDTSDTEAPVWGLGWDFGANDGDGIHIENVYAGRSGMDLRTFIYGGMRNNSVEILGNTIDQTGDDGVEVHYSGRTLVAGNDITNSGVGLGHPYGGGDEGFGHDAIHVGGIYDDYNPYSGSDYSVRVLDNTVDTTGDDGIEVHFSGRTLVGKNTLSHIGYGDGYYYGHGDEYGADGIHVMNVDSNDNNMPFSVDIRRNTIDVTADDGIEVANSGRTRIKNNSLSNIGHGEDSYYGGGDIYGSDGIHVRNVRNNSEDERQFDVRIVGNDIVDTGDDGIEVNDTHRVLVARNTVDQAGDDGINVLRFSPFGMHMTHPTASQDVFFIPKRRVPSKAVIRNNVVTNTGTAYPEEIIGEVSLLSAEPITRRFGGDGIEVGGFEKIIVKGNEVSNSVDNGLFVSGPHNGKVEVSDNTFTDNDIGANFESGEIDLTGDGNTFNGGRVGMRFSPFEEYYPYYGLDAVAAEVLPIEPMFASMSLVNNTIGAQTFNGQSENYVELDNGAFFAPGTPTLLNALDSTYVGTPFGTFTPSVDYPAGFPLDVVAYLESKFFHFNDDGSLGLFFFPLLPGINQEDIFNFFGPNAGALSGLNITILGLPGIPGGSPVALNNITPAAGGDNPDDLNAIETAAGGDGDGENTGCWNDALNVAGSGQSVNLSYGGSAEELLNGEANCGS